ncbi:MAG TPA: hypothetical protein VGD98_15780 [Ktedonobacteraceae bacterium]
MEFLIFTLILILLDLAAWRWGADSRDSIDSPEWRRRQLRTRAL